jgi:hypothetical protein
VTADSILSLYRMTLRGWHHRSWTVDGSLEACFDRDGATVALDTTGLGRFAGTQRTYNMVVDHAGGRCD